MVPVFLASPNTRVVLPDFLGFGRSDKVLSSVLSQFFI
jgi:hypothetical protein